MRKSGHLRARSSEWIEHWPSICPSRTIRPGSYARVGRRVIPPSQHKRLFLDAMGLKNTTDWNHEKIAAELERRHGVRVPSMTVYFWITGRSSPLGHWNVFELKPSRELAYVLGVMKGDG